MKLISLLFMITFMLFIFGCSYKVGPEISLDNHFTQSQPSEKNLNLDSNSSLGMAMSGGGIRSALFNIGVLKALYDENITQKIDVMSAVSGGGYALYWLLSSQMTPEGKIDTSYKLGEKVFQDKNGKDNFLLSTCELYATANFALTYDSYFFRKFLKSRDYYRGQIVRTFGHIEDPKKRNWKASALNKTPYGQLTIGKYQEAINQKKLPYFIFNATASKIEDINNSHHKIYDNGWRNGLFEMTPFFRGNEGLEYLEWNSSEESLPLSQVAAVSGAAQRCPLGQKFDKPYKNINYTLSDGGHSENLAAVALIRRGVPNIILVDAEYDHELAFEGYYILKDRLRAWGFNLKNDLLDSRARVRDEEAFWLRENTPPLQNGEFEVEVTDLNNKHVSTIYYIKMAVVGELKKELWDQYSTYVKGMKESKEILSENAKIRGALNKRLKSKSPLRFITPKTQGMVQRQKTEEVSYDNWDCQDLNDKEYDFDPIKWIKEEAIYRANDEHADDFPHKTTLDQSWYNDETVAWIGLGYIQGKRLVDKYNNKLHKLKDLGGE